MSIELNPVGVACNLSCPYCYEHPMRDAGNFTPGYDLDAMKRGLEAEGGAWSLFGGEPLLMKMADLEEMLRFGHAKFGHTGVQTNGTLITPEHVELFRRYNTYVGISVDGPGELNDSRWAGSLEKTREATRRSFEAIDMLIAAGRIPSLIVTLYRGNAVGQRLGQLVTWFCELDAKGIQHVRLHALEVDSTRVRDEMALTEQEADHAFDVLMTLQSSLRVQFDIFSDMARLLLGQGDGASCIWHGCDPLTTPAVRAINGLGGRSNCSRTNKDGIDWVKTDQWGNERSRILYLTPQEDGGCKDCRFFAMCQGQCPGTAIGGDWRNRSDQCRTWFNTFERLEQTLVALGRTPISLDPARRRAAEDAVLADRTPNREHGDHWDAPDGYTHVDGGWDVHGDAGATTVHGDIPHEDHVDA
jgi:uncharacterized protein